MSAVFKNISLLNGKRHLAFKYISLIKLDLSIEVVDKSEDNTKSFIDSFNGVWYIWWKKIDSPKHK